MDKNNNLLSSPANGFEEKNSKFLRENCDYYIKWEDCQGNKNRISEELNKHIECFIRFLENRGYI